MSEPTTTIDTWACLELMGHVCVYGKVTEEEHFGQNLGRIEIPMSETEWQTQWFGGSSIYRISPCTEEVARARAGYRRPAISQWTGRRDETEDYDDHGENDDEPAELDTSNLPF